jgi:hypothetical protein
MEVRYEKVLQSLRDVNDGEATNSPNLSLTP